MHITKRCSVHFSCRCARAEEGMSPRRLTLLCKACGRIWATHGGRYAPAQCMVRSEFDSSAHSTRHSNSDRRVHLSCQNRPTLKLNRDCARARAYLSWAPPSRAACAPAALGPPLPRCERFPRRPRRHRLRPSHRQSYRCRIPRRRGGLLRHVIAPSFRSG